ncbi:hypothetical protein [Castellaniella sp.]|uniref:hypothetical protein n=1 Tax=Castellaniella sp. TaxID=1955812 RepID=UPI003C734515
MHGGADGSDEGHDGKRQQDKFVANGVMAHRDFCGLQPGICCLDSTHDKDTEGYFEIKYLNVVYPLIT